MRKVSREEIVDYQTYGDRREETRTAVMAIKRPRRIHVGEVLTFLFENADTIRYQIQEILRAERIARESDILAEIDTYNSMLGEDGELGCCLLIEIDDKQEREERLRLWVDLPQHLYLRCADGTRIRPIVGSGQADEGKISSVQYLKFPVGERIPVAVGSDLPALTVETVLDSEQQQALLADLKS